MAGGGERGDLWGDRREWAIRYKRSGEVGWWRGGLKGKQRKAVTPTPRRKKSNPTPPRTTECSVGERKDVN